MKVGIGMVSREEVGLIVAGVGASSEISTSGVYTGIIIIMVALTTVVAPIWLKRAYQRERFQEPV